MKKGVISLFGTSIFLFAMGLSGCTGTQGSSSISSSGPISSSASSTKTSETSSTSGTSVSSITSSSSEDPAPTGPKTYYVSAYYGDDNNNGLSEAKPIKTLTKVSSLALDPGDKVLFKCGEQWKKEALELYCVGTAENPIKFGSYGEGNKPIFRTLTKDLACIYLRNSTYVDFSSLFLADSYGGVEVMYSTALVGATAKNGRKYANGSAYDQKHVTFDNIEIKDMSSTYNSKEFLYNHFSFGIVVKSCVPTDKTMLDGLSITNCKITNANCGMNFAANYGDKFIGGTSIGKIANLTLENNNLELCGQWGIRLANITSGKVKHNVSKFSGQLPNHYGSCAFMLVDCSNVEIDDLTIKEHYRNIAQEYDGCAVDFEGGNHNCQLLNSTLEHIDGCGVFIYDNNRGNVNTDIYINNVKFINCGFNVKSSYRYNIYFANGPHTGTVNNCTFSNFRDVGTPGVWTDGSVPVIAGNNSQFPLSNCTKSHITDGFQWSFENEGNVKQFGKTWFYLNDPEEPEVENKYYGSTVNSVKARDCYLTALFDDNTEYISGPNCLDCGLSWVKTFKMKFINETNATKIKFEYNRIGDETHFYSFEHSIGSGSSQEQSISIDLTTSLPQKSGSLAWFRIYLSNLTSEGTFKIASMSLEG